MNNGRQIVTLQESLYEQMMQNSELCDVALEFGGWVFRAHWCVLIKYPFFEAMYRSGLKEKREGVIRISEGSYEAIQAVVRFMYTGTARVEYRLLSEVLHVADYLQITELVQICEQCLLKMKNSNTCIDTYILSRKYSLNIYDALAVYIINNLNDVIQYPPNGQIMTIGMIKEIMTHETAKNVSQEVLYTFYRKWLAYDVSCRQEDFEDLFCTLDLHDTSHSFFKSLECDFIQMYTLCRDHYLQAKRSHIRKQLNHPNETANVILVVGEIEINANKIIRKKHKVFACVIGSVKWSHLADFPRDLDMYDKYIMGADDTALYVIADEYLVSYEINSVEIRVHKFDYVDARWSIIKFTLKTKNTRQLRLSGLVCVNQRIFAAAKTRLPWRHPNGMQLFELNEHNDGCQSIITINGTSKKLDDVKICAVGNRFVFVHCMFLQSRLFGVDKTHKMALLDTCTGKIKHFTTITQAVQDEDDTMEMEELIFPSENSVIISRVDCPYFKVLDVVNHQISAVNESLLPRELLYATDHDADQDIDLDFQFGCGTNVVSVFNRSNERFKAFDYSTRTLLDVPALPYRILKSTTVHCNIKAKLLKCPIDCPHCLYELRLAI